MRRSRHIRGRRASLERVRDADTLEELIVEGRSVASLAGLERMTNLDALALERLHEPDLMPLGSLARLERLLIEDLTGDVDFAAVGALTSLRALWVNGCTRRQGERLAALDFQALPHLEDLSLVCTEPGARIPFRLSWLGPDASLRRLNLSGFVFPDEDTERVCGLSDRLELVYFTPTSPRQRDRLLAEGRARRINVWPLDGGSEEVLHVSEYRHASGRRTYYLVVDVAERRGLETTLAAQAHAERAIRRRRPEILDELTIETASEGVWFTADRPEPLHAVREILLGDR
jgi:hypothetical protein